MSDEIDVSDVLALAREALQNDVVPHVPAGSRFAAAMIANALAIAARELEDHSDLDIDLADARDALPQFHDDRELIEAIRYGALDDPSTLRDAAKAYAAALVRRRLAVTRG